MSAECSDGVANASGSEYLCIRRLRLLRTTASSLSATISIEKIVEEVANRWFDKTVHTHMSKSIHFRKKAQSPSEKTGLEGLARSYHKHYSRRSKLIHKNRLKPTAISRTPVTDPAPGLTSPERNLTHASFHVTKYSVIANQMKVTLRNRKSCTYMVLTSVRSLPATTF